MQSSSQASSQTSGAVSSVAGGSVDPFKKLRKMSRTAGVGAVDYVAVNTPSVIALFAGLASLLALLTPILLAIGLFALVCGIIAWVQVSRSNGTQMGRRWALLGILLAGTSTGLVGARALGEARSFEASKVEIAALFDQLDGGVAGKSYDKAYATFGPTFQKRFSPEEFSGVFKSLEGNESAGAVTALKWNNRLEAVEDLTGQGADIARAVLYCTLEKQRERIPCEVTLIRRKEGDGRKGPWRIEVFEPLFEKSAAERAAAAKGAGGGGGGGR